MKSRRMRWVGHVACMGKDRKTYKVLVGKPEVKSPVVRPRHTYENGIRITGGMFEWVQLAQKRGQWRAVVNAAMNLRVLAPWS
jgi:hypothetical protein